MVDHVDENELAMAKTVKSRFPINNHLLVSEEDTHFFAQFTKDKNKIHLDASVSGDAGFEGMMAHGHMTASILAGVIGTVLSDLLVVIHPAAGKLSWIWAMV